MIHSPADVTRQLLIDAGFASDITTEGTPGGDWPIYDSNEPTSPDEIITVYDRDVPYQGRTHYDGEMQGPEGILFRIRSKTKRAGYLKAAALRDLISKSPQAGGVAYQRSVKVEETWYVVHCYSDIGKVIPMGKESPTSTRRIFVLSCVVTVVQCPPSS